MKYQTSFLVLFSAAFLFLSTACNHLTITRSETATGAGTAHVYDLDAFLVGFISFPNLPSESEVCKNSRIDTIEYSQTTGDVWIAIATLSIYVPHRVTITCSNALNSSH